jgi:hypothetical protein
MRRRRTVIQSRHLSYLVFAMAVYRLDTQQVIQKSWLCDFDALAVSALGMVLKPYCVAWKALNLVEGDGKIEKVSSLVGHR